MPKATTLRLDLAADGHTDALELLRRVRVFADEMRNAGLVVDIYGNLTIDIRSRSAAAPKDAPAKVAADA